VAGHAARLTPVADGLLLLSPLAQRGDVGAHPHGVAREQPATAGTRGDPQRGDRGQSKRQDQSKGGLRGYDAHKQVKGRKRHLLVDTQGLLLKVVVSAADVQDRDGARLLAHAVRLYGPHLPRLSLVWADAAYGGQLVEDLRQLMGWEVAVVKRSNTQPRTAFAVQPHRWIVERTFSWFGGFRRLSKDYESELESSEAMIYAAMSHLLLRRLAKQKPAGCGPDG
jgi:putative transposase